jgi:hypothetical protein
MSQVDKEREAMKKLAEAAAELAKLNNTRPLTKEQAEELSRRAT